jgi:hypothetical protein
VWALEGGRAAARRDAAVVPLTPALILVGAVAVAVALAGAGHLTSADLRAVLGAALHGALLTAALGAAAAASDARWTATRPALVTIALIALGAGAARFDGRGPILWLGVLLWLARLGARGQLLAIGVRGASRSALFIGALAGAVLGGHVLVSATLTLGYRPRDDGLAAWLLAIAYDAGLNVPAAELFIRGVVFDRFQRQGSFATGAIVATVAYLARFLSDPRLPATVEVFAGATLYLTLLSLVNSWLFWRSGSVVPTVTSALIFFAAYRLLGI